MKMKHHDLMQEAADEEKRSLLDARLLSKFPAFHGGGGDWKMWSFKVRGHIDNASPTLGACLAEIGTRPLPVEQRLLGAPEVTLDKGLFYILTQFLEGDACSELMGLPPGHGIEWWRLNVRRHEPQTGGTQRAKLITIMNPDNDPTIASITDYFQKLTLWEAKVADHDRRVTRHHSADSCDVGRR